MSEGASGGARWPPLVEEEDAMYKRIILAVDLAEPGGPERSFTGGEEAAAVLSAGAWPHPGRVTTTARAAS